MCSFGWTSVVVGMALDFLTQGRIDERNGPIVDKGGGESSVE